MRASRVTAGPTTRTFTGSGISLAADVWGDLESERPAVVLLHGGGQTRHSWGRTGERLAALGRPVVALDARGHGASDWDPEKDYSLDAFSGDLREVLASLGRPAVLVGASLGGITSLAVAGEHPEAVRALVMVDVVIDVDSRGVERIQKFMSAHPEGFADLDEVADAIAAYNPNRPRPRNLDGLRKNVRLAEDGRWRWHWDPAVLQIANEPTRGIEPERLRRAAARVTVPTLIVRGLRSDVVGDAGIEDMLRRIPQAEVADVAAAGHMVAGDDNDVFGATLERFLRW
jgi:pimeloyl-ACP methyl ester carboxylesterase